VYDVLIIGGGPAGSMAGMLLARRGLDVAIVERHRFPRDKVCGECLSALGVDVVDRAGLNSVLHDAVTLNRSILHPLSGATAAMSLPRPMVGIRRSAFDARLLNAARNAGAIILQPARCESVDSGPVVRIRHLDDNLVETIAARLVLVADGKGALLGQPSRTTGDLGIKAHFANVDAPVDAIGLFAMNGYYCGLAPIDGGQWNVAAAVPARVVREARGDLERVFLQMPSQNAAMAKQFARATRVSSWLAAPLPRFGVRPNWRPDVIPLGNAVAAIEPIGGEGMGLALRSAELAVEAIVEGRRLGSIDVQELRARYQHLWSTRRLACRAAAVGLSSWLGTIGTSIVRRSPMLLRGLLRAIGK
jgi:flavin-dependent dehydrogenase